MSSENSVLDCVTWFKPAQRIRIAFVVSIYSRMGREILYDRRREQGENRLPRAPELLAWSNVACKSPEGASSTFEIMGHLELSTLRSGFEAEALFISASGITTGSHLSWKGDVIYGWYLFAVTVEKFLFVQFELMAMDIMSANNLLVTNCTENDSLRRVGGIAEWPFKGASRKYYNI
ncbi:hypothetical protein BDZ97DRAFT_2062606 [Flammula alnicola]|nr:hypothetical protein BDZ97DRAFT_2062606 [Flammula alnicola]